MQGQEENMGVLLSRLLFFWFNADHASSWASLVAQIVKKLPAMQETQAGSLGQEDPLEKRVATQSSTLA